jgi:quinol-cytochrome oxidoreductase complex cytochrome b subunit
MVTPNHIVPEWYLLPYYAILRSITFDVLGIPAKLLGVVLSLGSIILLFFVPWLDTSRVRSARFRPIYRLVSWLLPIDVIALGYVGSQPPEGWVVTLGQVATFYYYFHFLVLMPLLGKIERPRPLPISIGTAVLEAAGGLGAAGSAQRH